jgi:hypothetical protein
MDKMTRGKEIRMHRDNRILGYTNPQVTVR